MTDFARIIGIDCAVDTKNVGIAVGVLDQDTVTVDTVQCGVPNPASFLANLVGADSSFFLALDAPLGWPAAMGEALAVHAAGDDISVSPNTLFRRDTDRFVKKMIGKQSLDVGADRIARTALAALNLLNEVRRLTGQRIPLAWETRPIRESCCIEVYPAATLEAHGLSSRGYKGKAAEQRAARRRIIDEPDPLPKVPSDIGSAMEANDDVFDAVVCMLAAADFLRGNSMPPENIYSARKEGWIWVRSKAIFDNLED